MNYYNEHTKCNERNRAGPMSTCSLGITDRNISSDIDNISNEAL